MRLSTVSFYVVIPAPYLVPETKEYLSAEERSERSENFENLHGILLEKVL